MKDIKSDKQTLRCEKKLRPPVFKWGGRLDFELGHGRGLHPGELMTNVASGHAGAQHVIHLVHRFFLYKSSYYHFKISVFILFFSIDFLFYILHLLIVFECHIKRKVKRYKNYINNLLVD